MAPMRSLLLVIALLVHGIAFGQSRDIVRLARSTVSFVSEAPLEVIKASTDRSKGALDRDERSFAIQVPMVEMQGFNAPLQREHFNENYMVSAQWPYATFSGRIIEAVDLRVAGTHQVRAKGSLVIRGQAQERVIPCTIEVTASGVRVRATFEVPVADHGIRIPRVVQQKVAATVKVDVDLTFEPQG